MAIEKHMLQTHSLFEKAGEVFEGVAKLKERIAELEKENAELRSKNEGLLYALADADTDLAMATRWRKVSEELPEEYTDVFAANLVLKDANEGWRKERIRRCRLLYEYCKLRWENEGCKRTLFWLKWQDRWIELERYYKEIDLNGEEEND